MPKNPKKEKEGTAEEDQKDHEYYYDDSHGYEEYDPEEEECDAATPGEGHAGIDDDSTEGAR